MYQEWFKKYEKLKNRGLKTMTEKEVIEKLTDNKKMTLIELIRKIKKEGMERFIVTRPEYIYTILDLLEKKDRTIQQLKDENKTLNRQAQQYFETTIIQSQQYDKERTEKDKIIDEMAKCIDIKLSSSRLGIILNKNVKPLESYKEDIKQYFERKVENGN